MKSTEVANRGIFLGKVEWPRIGVRPFSQLELVTTESKGHIPVRRVRNTDRSDGSTCNVSIWISGQRCDNPAYHLGSNALFRHIFSPATQSENSSANQTGN